MGKQKQQTWKEVKLSGHLITDDSVGSLEGLIGLEVLEDYDKTMVKKLRPKRQKRERKEAKGQRDSSKEQHVDDGEPVEKKKKKQKGQKSAVVTGPDQEEEEENQEPGKFVLAPAPDADDYSDTLPEWQYYNLQNVLLEAIKENGFTKPTEIQRLALSPAIMGRRDILGAAETGSGKTLAFGLPILNGILHLKKEVLTNPNCSIRKGVKNVQPDEGEDLEGDDYNDEDLEMDSGEIAKKPLFAVILTPTRELAVQVRDHIKAVAKYSDIKVAAIFGGMAIVKQKRVLKGCPEIVVATPGRLWELLKEGDEHLNKIVDISFLVIDETDRMVEKGHFEELKLLMERLNRDQSKKSKRQNFIFSATLTLVHDIPDHLRLKNANRRKKLQGVSADEKLKQFIQGLGISQPKIIDITKQQGTAEKLTECRIVCALNEKDYYLYYFLQQHPGRTIVFCNSIDCVRRLGNLFGLLGCKPLPLHANMVQKQRLKNLERFRDLPDALLIATDVAARGLDIPKVDHVIHYQVPRTSENYVHRSGRTARANTEGITVLLMEPGEMKYYNKMCKTLNRKDDLPIFPVSFRHLSAVKERVNLAREVDVLDLRARKETNEIGWFEKAAEEMDIMLDEFESHNTLDDDLDRGRGSRKQEIATNMKAIQLKKKDLMKMLQSPIFPRGFSYKYPTATGQLSIPLMGMTTADNAVTVMRDALQKESLLKGDLLKNYKGKGSSNKNKRKPNSSDKENDTKPTAGQKSEGESGEKDENSAPAKGVKRYFMPQPKTGGKSKRQMAKKAAKKAKM